MERKLCSIQEISEITPITNADRIECLHILGWTCVAKKGEFKKGDKVIYCEIDSLIPRKSWSEFLFKDNKQFIRIKTEKLRGQLSQGIVFPISILSEYNIGDEVTNILGVTKYEPIIPASISGLCKGLFPTHIIPKTDEIRIQSVSKVLNEINNQEVYITTKIDGTSMTVYYYKDKFGVCSRNLELKESTENSLWKTAIELKLKEKLNTISTITTFGNCAIQGELAGPGIAKNPLNLKKLTFYVFNIYDIDNHCYLNYKDFLSFCSMLQLQTVPIEEVTIAKNWTIEYLLERSKGLYKGTNNQKEGIVIRPTNEMYSNTLKGRLSFKVVSNEYLAKGGN